MTCTESRYRQIEKEALAATWACEKFATYIQGKTVTLETDHKPLVPLLIQLLCQLSLTIWTWYVERNITLIAEHLPGR